jgi:hypothetical protein
MPTHTDHPAYENGEITATSDSHLGGGRGDLIAKVRQNFLLKRDEEAIEMMEFFEEIFERKTAPVTRASALLWMSKILDIFEMQLEIVRGNPCEQTFKGLLWAFDDPRIADSLNHWTPADGARLEGKKKFTLYKRIEAMAKRLGLPRRKDQRTDASREKMSTGLKAKYQENRV